jgi:hypothetical protein
VVVLVVVGWHGSVVVVGDPVVVGWPVVVGGRVVVVGRWVVVVGRRVVVVVALEPGAPVLVGPVGGVAVVEGDGGPAATAGPMATPPSYRRAQPSTVSTYAQEWL